MDDKRGSIIWLNSIFMAVSTLAIITRLLTRALLVHLVGADDVLITIAFFLALVNSSFFILSTKYGEGLHVEHLEPANIPAYTRSIIIGGFSYTISQMFIKLSYLALYLRLSPTKKFRVTLYISMALVCGYGIPASIIYMVQCIPFSKLWFPNTSGSCINISAFQISTTVINMLLDMTIFILPIPVLWGLKLPKRQRLGLVGIFGLGVLLASVLRLKYLISLLKTPSYRSDNTWTTVYLPFVDSLNWSTVEIHLALLISCTAAFKALIHRCLPGFLGTYGTKTTFRGRNTYHQSIGDSYVLQSRSGNISNVKTTVSANINEVIDNRSQEHIIENGEGVRCETTVSIQSSSTTNVNSGATFHTS